MEQTLGFHGAGDFHLASNGALTRRGDAARAPWALAGARIIRPQLYDDLPPEPFSANEVWTDLIDTGRLHGLPMPEFWLHVGDPDALDAANALAEGRAVNAAELFNPGGRCVYTIPPGAAFLNVLAATLAQATNAKADPCGPCRRFDLCAQSPLSERARDRTL